MPAIDTLLKRLGFVRLARYGLVLTPEGRIMSLRPAVLDDGLGGRIVGWPEGDLAAMELQRWEPARPASKQAVATRVAVAPPRIPLPKPAPMPTPVPVPAPVVAQPPQVEEDDWEWEIALARARAAAEEAEQAAASIRKPALRARPTVPPPVVTKLAVVTIPPLERPATEPIEFEDKTSPGIETVQVARIVDQPALPVERPQAAPVGVRKQPTQPIATIAPPVTVISVPPPVAQPASVAVIPPKPAQVAALPPPRPVTRHGTAPPTIIPVPKLPSIKDRVAQIQPVVSSSRPSRTRFAKGTGPVTQTKIGVAPPPPIRPAEDGDKTSPGMPAVAAAVTLPSIKRYVR